MAPQLCEYTEDGKRMCCEMADALTDGKAYCREHRDLLARVRVVEYEHHGVQVKVQERLRGTHREACLCFLDCAEFKPGTDENCKRAALLFAFCCTFDMTTPVYECPAYHKEEKTDG